MDAAINLGGTFGFVTCRSVHVVFVALLIGCLGISWLSLSLSACLIPQYSFLSVDSERSSLLSFDMLEFISIGLVSAVKFRPCCVFRMDPIDGSNLSVPMHSSVSVVVLSWSSGSSPCFAIGVFCVLFTVSSSFPM